MRPPLVFLLALLAASLDAQTPQVPFITPYPGSTLGAPVKVSDFDEYELLVSSLKGGAKTQKLGGRVTRIFLRGPKDRSMLEIFSNYEQALRKDGFTTLYRCADTECGSGGVPEMGTTFNPTVEQYYLAARKTRPDGDLFAAVMLNDRYNPAARINLIEVKPMQGGLVKVTADQMAKDIAATGRVLLYSILFDTGKADVKRESDATIAEIAKFLAANPSLKIYVVGHTDNVGAYTANADLSNRRAQAVVNVLTTRHGIASARLRAVGVAAVAPVATNRSAEGRQLNRRVELVEQ